MRGLADLAAPDPAYLGRTARIARGLGLDRLTIAVLEESLIRAGRHQVRFLDELVRGLDQAEDAGMGIWLMAPAQRILGVDWVAPYLVSGSMDSRAVEVFVDGAMRPLRPFPWWKDPSIIGKRVQCFRELAAAVSGHPALGGWIVMDRVLEWSQPDPDVADWLLKSYCAEIRGRDQAREICLSLDLSGLVRPQMVQGLTRQVDALHMRGVENRLDAWTRRGSLANELSLACYLGSMARWLFGRPVSLEVGWGMMMDRGIEEEALQSVSALAQQEAAGITWVNLIDPENRLRSRPPWNLRPGPGETGLLDPGGDPKEGVEALIQEIHSMPVGSGGNMDFIDIDRTEYLADPKTHLRRLWDHFQEATG